MNYFIEGLQGAGKSTLVQTLWNHCKENQLFREGDYSPVELAWCAYVTKEQYDNIVQKYSALQSEIEKKTTKEEKHYVICYTQILTDIAGFHKDLERYEIYNGNLEKDEFERIILERLKRWQGNNQIFECSIFQNIIENQMLYYQMTEDEIILFYKRVYEVLKNKKVRLIYLDTPDIRTNIEVIKKERSDESGNEMWFPLMIRYIEESPYGKEKNLKGMEGLLTHLERRRSLELRLIREVFRQNCIILTSKAYSENDIVRIMNEE